MDPCIHVGRTVPPPEGQSPKRTWFECDKGHGIVCACQCGKCPDHSERPPAPDRGAPGPAGIVLGTYGLPQLARLQILTLADSQPGTPILIADDGSGQDEAFYELESAFPHVTYWPSPERRGHYAGDLSAVWKGLHWAKSTGLQYLCKLSQRFIWLQPGWLTRGVERLHRSGKPILMQRCLDNRVNLYIRSECVIYSVPEWSAILDRFDRQKLGNPTELYLWDIVAKHFNRRYETWADLTVDRYQATPGTIWHGSHSVQHFRNLAARHGITLDPEFTVAGWEHVANWKRG